MIVPDSKPDILNTITTSGSVCIYKKEIMENYEEILAFLTREAKAFRDVLQWEDFWKEGHNNKIYMCHGKDNIMFHSIILNALLLGQKENYHLVDTIVSAEYLNFNDQKFSKSKGIGMTAIEALDLYESDSLRFHLLANGPEKKDTNFTIEDFENTHNGEILNKFGSQSLTNAINDAIIDTDFLLSVLSTRYNLGTPDGRTQAALAFFPYVDALSSDIQKDTCLEKLCQAYNLKPEAVKADFNNRDKARSIF